MKTNDEIDLSEDHTIAKPEMYEFWRDYEPELKPSWPGKLLSFTYSHPPTLHPITPSFDPRTGAEADDHMQEAMQLSYSLLYWLQTEAPRPDGETGWPGLRLRGDVVGTEHGLAKRPYIRESRRIEAEFTVTERHVGTEARMDVTGLSRDEVTAAQFDDSVGIGSYGIDLHPSTGGANYMDFDFLPFQIPLGALIPVRMENLLPACKNLGVTHITNGCYRLHPVEWDIGESAGLLAAFALGNHYAPRYVRNEEVCADFQRFIQQQGVEIRWPNPLRTSR